MQQIFVLVNRLLISEPATRKRKLCVRTYKVIPLSQRSGVVEWCESTRPLGEYLVGSPNHSNSAHSRYRPMDWTALECRKKMTVYIIITASWLGMGWGEGGWEVENVATRVHYIGEI